MLDLATIKNDAEVAAIMDMTAHTIEALGYTEHTRRHSGIVSRWAGMVLRTLGRDETQVNLAEIAGYLHDIGNCINRQDHAMSGAVMAYRILTRLGMSYHDAAQVMAAIGNHDEQFGLPVSDVCAALILADKADVHKSRVRNPIDNVLNANIHDRVNLAAERSTLETDKDSMTVTLNIHIDTQICSVMDYFEIYFGRMQLCRRAAEYLGCKFSLIINGTSLV